MTCVQEVVMSDLIVYTTKIHFLLKDNWFEVKDFISIASNVRWKDVYLNSYTDSSATLITSAYISCDSLIWIRVESTIDGIKSVNVSVEIEYINQVKRLLLERTSDVCKYLGDCVKAAEKGLGKLRKITILKDKIEKLEACVS